TSFNTCGGSQPGRHSGRCSSGASGERRVMKSWIWFRALAVVLAIFTLGHTLGSRHAITASPEEAAVITGMQLYRVPVMGFLRSYWEFYRGLSITISVLLAALMVIAWQVGTLSRRNPQEARPFAIT